MPRPVRGCWWRLPRPPASAERRHRYAWGERSLSETSPWEFRLACCPGPMAGPRGSADGSKAGRAKDGHSEWFRLASGTPDASQDPRWQQLAFVRLPRVW